MFFQKIAILFSSSLLVFACANDSAVSEEQLQGRWELVQATIDGEDTDRLDNLYFEFPSESQIRTNLFGYDGDFDVTRSKNTIKQDGQPSIIYTIDLGADTLSMVTELHKKEFVLSLTKAQAQSEAL